jgi:hypothetical protein
MLLLCLRRRAQCFTRTLARSVGNLRSQCPRPGSDEFQRNFVTIAIRFQSSGVIPLRKQLKDEAKAKKASSFNKACGKPILEESDPRLKEWELTVGIEIHAQLNTARKLFSCRSEHLPNISMLTAYYSCINLH